jgi:hypothetical protein
MQIVGTLIFVGMAVWVGLYLFRPTATIGIRRMGITWKRGRIRFLGPIPRSKRSGLEAFFREYFAQSSVTIRGVRGCDKRIAWTIDGGVTPGEVQQIRNYLQSVL